MLMDVLKSGCLSGSGGRKSVGLTGTMKDWLGVIQAMWRRSRDRSNEKERGRKVGPCILREKLTVLQGRFGIGMKNKGSFGPGAGLIFRGTGV